MAEQAIEDPSLLCPACGFDLRATISDRCGECGLPFDRAMLTVSGIPWAHRHRIGRFHAYFKTLWQFTLDSKSLSNEASKPQDLADARVFRRIIACILAAAFLVAFAAILYVQRNFAFLAIEPPSPFGPSWTIAPPKFGYLYDLAVPWSAGAVFPPVLPLCLILLASYWSGAQRFIFRLPSSPPHHQQRVLALSHYTTAPMTLALPSAIIFATSRLLEKTFLDNKVGPIPGLILGLSLLGGLCLLIALLGTVFRTSQWLIRTRRCGLWAMTLALAEWAALCLLGAIILLGLLP